MTEFRPLEFLPPLAKQILLPSLAGSTAVCFTHPMDLTKIRLQLDNEMVRKGSPRSYKGILHCLRHNWQRDGIRGLQRGLSYGIVREFMFNGCRIGLYDAALVRYKFFQGAKHQSPTASEQLIVGQFVGAFAGAVVNPVEVLKVRSQSMGGLTGHQHKQMENIFRAAIALVRDEGYRGFFRGIEVQVVRGFLGAGTQLPAYGILKTRAGQMGYNTSSPMVHVVCSALSAGVSILCCNPADVVRTRMYNQPFDNTGRGKFYSSGFDALTKTVRSEGLLALYKGGWTHYARLGPHIILVFVFLEQLRKWS